MAIIEYAPSRFTFQVGLLLGYAAVCVQVFLLKSPSLLPSTALSDVYGLEYNDDWLVGFQRATFLPVIRFC